MHRSKASGHSGTETTREDPAPPVGVYQPSDPARHSRQLAKYHAEPKARSRSGGTGAKIHSVLDVAGLSTAVRWGTTAEMNSSSNHTTRPSPTLQPRRIECSSAMPVAGTGTHAWSSRARPAPRQYDHPAHSAPSRPIANVARARWLKRGIGRPSAMRGPWHTTT